MPNVMDEQYVLLGEGLNLLSEFMLRNFFNSCVKFVVRSEQNKRQKNMSNERNTKVVLLCIIVAVHLPVNAR